MSIATTLPTVQIAAVINEAKVDADSIVINHEFPLPQLNDDDILVRNYFAGVNPVDYKVRQSGFYINSYPAILGVDFSGIVVATGSSVSKFKVGDSVSGCNMTHIRGTYCQYVVCSESQAALNPESISHQVAGSLPAAFMTAFQSLLKYPSINSGHKGSLKGKTVLIIGGSGGVGLAAILLAKHYFHVEKIISISSPKNAELITKLGVDQVLDYTKGKDHLKKELENLKGSIDLVLDCVGSYEEYYPIELVKQDEESQFVTIVRFPQGSPEKVFGSERMHQIVCDRNGSNWATMLNWLSENGLWKEIPIQTLNLDQVVQAHKLSETGRTVGKIVLQIP